MNKDKNTDFSNAICKIKGYRYTILKLLGIILIFFSGLTFGIVYGKKDYVSTQTLTIICIVCGIISALSLGLVIFDYIANSKMKNKDCVILFEDGITVFVNKPKRDKGYKHFAFDELQDYGFINIIRKKDSGETLWLFKEKKPSAQTYLFADLMNYGYMRITTKDGGYYNVPVGDIQTVKNFLKERTQIEEFIYIRIAGIHDDMIIKLD